MPESVDVSKQFCSLKQCLDQITVLRRSKVKRGGRHISVLGECHISVLGEVVVDEIGGEAVEGELARQAPGHAQRGGVHVPG